MVLCKLSTLLKLFSYLETSAYSSNCLIRSQERLAAGHGVQCGFCSPGMVMSMFALLRNNPHPSELEIEHAIKGLMFVYLLGL